MSVLERYKKAVNTMKKGAAKGNKNVAAIREYRAEASRLAAIANKRIARLENNNLQDSPAYQRWLADGAEHFSVRGKTYNEVQQLRSRLRRLIDSETSTVRGALGVVKEMADNTGIAYKNIEDLKAKAPKFFELQSKVEQYLRTVEDAASAIGYNQIWEAINTYVQDANIDLSNSETDIDGMVAAVSKALTTYNEKIDFYTNWYSVRDLTDK